MQLSTASRSCWSEEVGFRIKGLRFSAHLERCDGHTHGGCTEAHRREAGPAGDGSHRIIRGIVADVQECVQNVPRPAHTRPLRLRSPQAFKPFVDACTKPLRMHPSQQPCTGSDLRTAGFAPAISDESKTETGFVREEELHLVVMLPSVGVGTVTVGVSVVLQRGAPVPL